MLVKKRTLLFLSAALFALSLSAQNDADKRPSPPAQASKTVGDLNIDIAYSQPGVKGRTIWGVLVPYGKVWRTGANEATTFEINQDVLIEGQKLAAGKYALFTIPTKKDWIVIFNSVPNQWGAYSYDDSKDILRVQVKPKMKEESTERLTFQIDEKGKKEAEVTMTWEKLSVGFTVKTAR